jgi:hypothetical protein
MPGALRRCSATPSIRACSPFSAALRAAPTGSHCAPACGWACRSVAASWSSWSLSIALQAWFAGGYRPPDAKTLLNQTVEHWLVFHARAEDSNLIVYFTHLMSYRGVIAEIHYGVDSQIPDRTFGFPADDNAETGTISAAVPTFIEVPRKTRFVSLQLRFKDGTSSPIRRYEVAADPSKYY